MESASPETNRSTNSEDEDPLEKHKREEFIRRASVIVSAETLKALNSTGEEIYLQSCEGFNIVPVSYFIKKLKEKGKSIDLKHRGLGDKGASAVAHAISLNHVIKELDLSDNWIGEEGGIIIADSLKLNQALQKLVLNQNRLGTAGCKPLLAHLSVTCNLTELHLSQNDLDDKITPYIAQLLRSTAGKTLRKLDLSHNNLGEKSGKELVHVACVICLHHQGQAVAQNVDLVELNLSWNCFRMKGAAQLVQGLKENRTLQKLFIAWNGLGNEGGKMIGDLIANNTFLEELDISHNRIESSCCTSMAKAIKEHHNLKRLNLGHNPFGVNGVGVLFDAIKQNESIQSVDLEACLAQTGNPAKFSMGKLDEDTRIIWRNPSTLLESSSTPLNNTSTLTST